MNAKRLFQMSAVVTLLVGGMVMAYLFLIPPAPGPSAVPFTAAALTRLTHDPASALRPAWSPDNRSIAFESNRDGSSHIYVMDADAAGLRAVTTGANHDRHPAWSPDGKSILYDSSDGTRQDIWSVDVTDGRRRQLTRVDGLAEYPSLSPDGERIAFYVYTEMTLNLWSARADGSDAVPLTRDLADAKRNEPTMAWRQPAWSPDSRSVAYTGGDGRSIWIMWRDGSEARSIVSDLETNHFPWFLADGRLAYITEYVPPRYDAAWTNAWAYDLQTGQRTLMQEKMSIQGPMDFGTDGAKILFHSPRTGNFEIYKVDLNAPGGQAALRGTPVSAEGQ